MIGRENCCIEKILDASMEIVLLFDADLRILGSNVFAQRELGYSAGELETMNLHMIFQKPEEFPGDCEEGEREELIAYRRNKTCFPIRISYCKMEEKDAPSFTVMFGMNISEEQALNRKFQRQEKKLGAAERLRQEFTSNVTHELRTPINGIKGHAQILADTELTGEQRQRLNTILRACTDMENLVNSILDYSKLEAGKFDLENKPFSFREFIHHVEAVNRIGIENKGLDFLVSFDETIPEELMGDELRLTQILNNLISNARKFTASGQITLKVSMTEIREKEVELFFMVVDTGIGIARSDLDKLFQPFSQVDASIARQYGGTGLGLAICKQLVENMGGRIQVSSIKGEGSNFSFNVLLGCLGKSEIIERQEQEMYLEAPAGEADEKKEKRKLHFEDGDEPLETEEEMIFGSEVNRREVRAHLIRIIICLEMERFDKAEEYLDAVKLFLKHAPQDVSKLLFRMGMQVRKENYDKSYAYYLQLSELLNQIWEEEA